jgi:hypothetical protein
MPQNIKPRVRTSGCKFPLIPFPGEETFDRVHEAATDSSWSRPKFASSNYRLSKIIRFKRNACALAPCLSRQPENVTARIDANRIFVFSHCRNVTLWL